MNKPLGSPSKPTIIVSVNGLSPDQPQTIIWAIAGILLIRPLRTNFSEILQWNSKYFIEENTFENVICKMAVILFAPQCVNGWNAACMWHDMIHVTPATIMVI